ncbi:S8 family serine peptidase [Saccharothrix lopnurensis]|uniref:S8 family serine peptidase n=1 Tax=Saccharothrix lopnurensis TaxID=1670621 RepID=A0ABW1NXL9_9PSEU
MSRRTAAVLVVGVAAALLTTGATAAEPGPPVPGSPARNPAAGLPGGVVTLLTGDRVTVRAGRVEVRPGRGRERMTFLQRRDRPGDLSVVPLDAAAGVRSGVLDERLFDVAGLLREGYDDRAGGVTPPIVATDGPAVAGEPLPSIGGYAVDAPKDGSHWSAVRAAGVTRVWLDGPVRSSLDRSVPRVGAPEAWRAGHTGRGATVAVLDTGIDAGHPDLAGAVVEARNFSRSDTTDDRNGHGTHVAATITGSGTHQGVAPDARLLVGKVLGDGGGGRESDIIAGMEWAASARADVVNMSLGTSWPTDGTDPMSLAVERLTERSGALFVVAAGNTGPVAGTIGSPAAADAALTVGAVDREDGLARFSSRGPRAGDGAIKPDITAPGVEIVAARARGGYIGTPVGESHVALSGTSMAAPHVAGAAAILAARHPDWTAEQLKGALTGSARPHEALSVHEQGAGRLDVARAVAQSLSVTPASLSLGTASWPHHDDAPLQRRLTYHNGGTTPLTLELTTDVRDPAGNPAPAGLVTASPSSVTVPPGGSAPVTVTTTTSLDSPDGRYGGAVVATGGGASARTPIALTKEVESHDVTLTFLGRDGEPTGDHDFRFADVARPESYSGHDPSGTVTVRLPRGAYHFDAYVPDSPDLGLTQFLEPDVEVTGPVRLVLDAREGRRIGMRVARPGARVGFAETAYHRETAAGPIAFGTIARDFEAIRYAPSRTSAPGQAGFAVWARLAEPDGTGYFAGSPYQYNVGWAHDGGVPARLERAFADRDLVEVTSKAPAAVAGGSGFVHQVAGGPLPMRVTERYSPGIDWSGNFIQGENPDLYPFEAYQLTASPRRFQRGRPVTEEWNAAVFGPAFPRTADPGQWARRFGDRLTVDVPLFTDQAPDHFGYARVHEGWTRLHRDGELIAEQAVEGNLSAELPAEEGTYRLHTSADRTGLSELSTRISADWTFTTGHVEGREGRALPLPAVRFAPSLDDRNRARAGRPFTFPVYVQVNGTTRTSGVRTAVQVSYDDGRTWRPVPLIGLGGRWVAVVVHPAGARFASLRAQARDGAGNSVDQTIIRAYALG